VLDQGRIVECGTPDELSRRPESMYAKLLAVQSSLEGDEEEVA